MFTDDFIFKLFYEKMTTTYPGPKDIQTHIRTKRLRREIEEFDNDKSLHHIKLSSIQIYGDDPLICFDMDVLGLNFQGEIRCAECYPKEIPASGGAPPIKIFFNESHGFFPENEDVTNKVLQCYWTPALMLSKILVYIHAVIIETIVGDDNVNDGDGDNDDYTLAVSYSDSDSDFVFVSNHE